MTEGDKPAKTLLQSFFVVLPPPRLNDYFGVMKADEPMLIQTLISKGPIERFDIGVLIGFSTFN